MKKILLTLCVIYASPALALTCLNDYSGTTGCDGNGTAAGDCATLGYSTSDVSGCTQYLYCPFDTSYKRCVSDGTSNTVDCTALGFTAEDKSAWCSDIVKCKDNKALTLCNKNLSCASNQILVNGKCESVYTSCAAANYIAPSECTAGYTCSGEVSIYTSVTGTLTTCYKNKLPNLCLKGYATDASFCRQTPDGETCGNYVLFKRFAFVGGEAEATHYAGEKPCWECSCGITVDNCTGSTYCPTGATCSECTNSSGKTLYNVTGCASGYVQDGDSCYDCAGMQTKMNAAGRKGSSGYKSYVQACKSRLCVTDSNTSCSGGNGYRKWDQFCLCNIIGNEYCLLKADDVSPEITEYPDGRAPACSDAERDRCKAAQNAWNEKVKYHNALCKNYQVTDKVHFDCNSYIPEDKSNGSMGALAVCAYY